MTKWNEQASRNNNLRASDLNPDAADKGKMDSKKIDGDQLNDLKDPRGKSESKICNRSP
ncbi:hypothetical protein RCO48_06750 [Peribacillus frigoritolerans]|nr:hypothetical protein [Peribacillus frigoritolerans]